MSYLGEQMFTPRSARMSDFDMEGEGRKRDILNKLIMENDDANAMPTGADMGNIEELGKTSANLAGMESIPDPTEGGSSFTLAKSGGGAAGANPGLMAGMVGLKAIQEEQKRKARNNQMIRQAQVDHKDSMTKSLQSMANLSTVVGLG